MNALDTCIKTILNDIRVELLDEFDKNFQRGVIQLFSVSCRLFQEIYTNTP